MGFFSRVANLGKGLWKSTTRSADDRLRVLEEELAGRPRPSDDALANARVGVDRLAEQARRASEAPARPAPDAGPPPSVEQPKKRTL